MSALVAVFLMAQAAQAGPPAPAAERLTLAAAVQRALAASAGLEQAEALQRAAEADVRAARAARLPQFDVQAGYSRLSDVPELFLPLPGGGQRTLFPNIPDNYRARAGVALPLYTGGRLQALGVAADRERTGAREDVRAAAADVVLETSSAYWSLATALASEAVLAEALEAYDAHLADARNRERLGLAARNEVLAVQVERDRAELAALRARNAADVARASLARLLGLASGAALEPAQALRSEAAPPTELDVEALAARALAQRPERAALAARVEAAEARVRAERGARLPQAALTAGYDYANPNRRILPPEPRFDDSWDVNLNVSWTVFDGGRASAAVGRARARRDAARSALTDLDRRLRLEVTQRALEVGTARAAAVVAARSVESARENLRVAGERYRAGVLGSSERIDAEVALLRAGLEVADADARVRLAEAALERAVGAGAPAR
jgi:outer membrane protein